MSSVAQCTYALGLDETVNETTGEGGHDLLGLLVALGLALTLTVFLVRLGRLQGSKDCQSRVKGGHKWKGPTS